MKIFGDLHGQFLDLMRLFDEYGAPSTAGDITYIDYLFLGDYVDRGAHSLETICLLLALKIEHPKAVHLIRGNHEVRLLAHFTAARGAQHTVIAIDKSNFKYGNLLLDWHIHCTCIGTHLQARHVRGCCLIPVCYPMARSLT